LGFFASRARAFERLAREAAQSGLWAGLHSRQDIEDGLKLGAQVGAYAVQQAEARGWYKP
jgi:sugar/nucleoside kinase (ribokinase family)